MTSPRIICPYTCVHPATDQALRRFASDAERVDVSGSEFGYWELVRGLWAAGEDFVVIEHDVEITADVLGSFESCAEPMCASYCPDTACTWTFLPGALNALWGCVRFRGSLAVSVPYLFDGEPIHWRRVAADIGIRLHRDHGIAAHRHEPDLRHFHRDLSLPASPLRSANAGGAR
jgi:hypothetical protein